MTDGYLNFDTSINLKGFEKGLDTISSGFGSLKQSVRDTAAAITQVPDVTVHVRTEGAEDALSGLTDAIGAVSPEVPVHLDVSGAEATLSGLTDAVEAAACSDIPVTLDVSGAEATLSGLTDAVASAAFPDIPVTLDIAAAEQAVERLTQEIEAARLQEPGSERFGGDDSSADAAAKDAARLDALDAASETLAILQERLREVEEALRGFPANMKISVQADASGATDAAAALSAVSQAADDLQAQTVNVQVSTNADAAAAGLSGLRQNLRKLTEAAGIRTKSFLQELPAQAQQADNHVSGLYQSVRRVTDALRTAGSDGKKAVQSLSPPVDALRGSFDRLRTVIGSVTAAMGLGMGIRALVESAAEVKAGVSQIEQTFGSLEDSARNAMQRVADESGILETRLHGVGTQIYAFAKTSGMESTQALSMMEDALQVAADSAAYYDRSLEETSATLQSFLKGNYANDAALGLSATETTRNAAAMRLYGKAFQELSEAQKQLTLLQMVKDANRLSGAEGQAAREADGWENVLGNLKEAWRQLLAVVGQPVLHLAIDTVKTLTAALTALTQQAQIAVNTLNQLFGWEQSDADAVTAAIAQSTDEQNALTEAVEETAKAQENVLAGFDKITKLGGEESDAGAAETPAVTPEITPVINDSQIEPTTKKAVEEAEKVFDRLIGIFDPLKRAWDEYSPDLLASAQKTADSIKGMFSAIGDSIYNVWTNGTGEEIAGTILRTFTNVSDTITNLNTRFTVAWEDDGTGDKIIQNAADHLGILLGTVEDVSKSTSDWSSTLDFSPLLKSFEGLQKSLTPVLDDIRDGVKWVLDNVLLPFGKWVIEDALPASLRALSSALKLLTAVIKPLKEPGQWLWDNFIQPLANWTGEIIVTGLEKLADVLGSIGDWIRAHPDASLIIGGLMAAFLGLYTVLSSGLVGTAITNIGSFLTTLGSLNVTIGVIIAGIAAWGYVVTELHANWQDIMDVLEASGGVFGFLAGWIEYARADIEEFFDFGDFGQKWRKLWESVGAAVYTVTHKIGGFFADIQKAFTLLTDVLRKRFADIADHIHTQFSGWLDRIRSTFGAFRDILHGDIRQIPAFLYEQMRSAYDRATAPFAQIGAWAAERLAALQAPFRGIADWFHGIFSDAWQRVLDVFSRGGSIFQGIESGISEVFKNTVNGLIDGINNVLTLPFWNIKEALRVIREWGIWLPWAGDWQPFAWLPDIDLPRIPRLAQGTVVPANYGEFLAVLGDNKREAEVVSPVSKIEEAMEHVLRRVNLGGGDLHLTLDLDGKPIYKNIIRLNRQSIRMTGKNPLNPKGGTTG